MTRWSIAPAEAELDELLSRDDALLAPRQSSDRPIESSRSKLFIYDMANFDLDGHGPIVTGRP